jgi:hypothetical protein
VYNVSSYSTTLTANAITANSISSDSITARVSISAVTLSAGTVKDTTLYSTNNFVSSLSATSITSTSISATSITTISQIYTVYSNNLIAKAASFQIDPGNTFSSMTGWSVIQGGTASNQIVSIAGPYGGQVKAWNILNSASASVLGGETENVPADPRATYRFSVWLQTDSNDFTTYFGLHTSQTSDTIRMSTGAADTNPYFMSTDLPSTGTWYLVIGYLHPYGVSNATSMLGGTYDVNGRRISNISNEFRFPENTNCVFRARFWNAYGDGTNNLYVFDPKIELIRDFNNPLIFDNLGLSGNIYALGNSFVGTAQTASILGPNNSTSSDTTYTRWVVVKSRDTSNDAGILLRRSDDSTGLDLWTDNSQGVDYIDNVWSGASRKHIFRTNSRTTPEELFEMNPTNNISRVGLSAASITSSSTLSAVTTYLGNLTAQSIYSPSSISSNTLSTGTERVTTEYVVNSFNTSLTSNALTSNSISSDSISARLTLSSGTTYTGPLTSQSIYSLSSISGNTLSAGIARFTTEYTVNSFNTSLTANSITSNSVSSQNITANTGYFSNSISAGSITSLNSISSSLGLFSSISSAGLTAYNSLSSGITYSGPLTSQSIYSNTSISGLTISGGYIRFSSISGVSLTSTSGYFNSLTASYSLSGNVTTLGNVTANIYYTPNSLSATTISGTNIRTVLILSNTGYFDNTLTANALTANSISAWNLTANNNIYLSRLSGSTVVGGNDNTPLEKFRVVDGNILVNSSSGLMSYNAAVTNRGRIVSVSASNDINIGDIDNIFTSKDVILYAGGNRYFWIKNDGKIGINSANPSAQLEVNGTISARDNVTLADAKQISTPTFTSGIFGQGFRLDSNNTIPGQSFLEVDNMRIRGTLRAHTFQKDIVRASNGFLLITDATTLVFPLSTNHTSITAKEQVFQPADIVWIKDIQDSTSAGGGGSLNINSEFMKINDNGTQVTSASGIVYSVTRAYGSGTAQTFGGNSTLVRIGTTGTTQGRSGLIMLDASSEASPFIDIIDTPIEAQGTELVLNGNLEGAYSSGVAPNWDSYVATSTYYSFYCATGTNAYSGLSAQAIAILTGTSEQRNVRFRQLGTTPVKVGENYLVDYYIKSTTASYPYSIYVLNLDGYNGYFKSLTASDAWQKTRVITTQPATHVSNRLI